MFAFLTRFAVATAIASLAYVLASIIALDALRAGTGDEPSNSAKLGIDFAAMALAVACAYVLARRWVFASRIPHRRALPRFVCVACGALALNELAFYGLLRLTPLPYLYALALTLTALGALTYVLLRAWVFAP